MGLPEVLASGLAWVWEDWRSGEATAASPSDLINHFTDQLSGLSWISGPRRNIPGTAIPWTGHG